MTIVQTERFKKDFAALSPDIQKRTLKQLTLFLNNPPHPSLNIKKIKGQPNIWEGRVTKEYRVTFTLEQGSGIILRRIGTHDVLKRP